MYEKIPDPCPLCRRPNHHPSDHHVLPKFAGDAQMRVMRELRRVLDPAGILNPGKFV